MSDDFELIPERDELPKGKDIDYKQYHTAWYDRLVMVEIRFILKDGRKLRYQARRLFNTIEEAYFTYQQIMQIEDKEVEANKGIQIRRLLT